MSRGDHVFVRRWGVYSHHGVDCGDGSVIHYVTERGRKRRVERTAFEDFARGGKVRIFRHRGRLTEDQVVRNAESRLGEEGYHLVRFNCEHLATWSATGVRRSRQVRRWLMAAPGAVASAGIVDSSGHLMMAGGVGMGAMALLGRRKDLTVPE